MNTVGEKKINGKEGEMSQAETSERRNGDTPLGRREQCNGFDQTVVWQQFCKHGPTRDNRGSCVFHVRSDVTQQWIEAT
jgi:hypothetical protein